MKKPAFIGKLTARRLLLPAASLLLIFWLPSRGAEPAARPVKLGYFIGGRTILFGRAFADGAFDREGVKVELITRWLNGELIKMPESLEKVAALEKEQRFGKMKGTEIINMIASGELDGGTVGEGSFIEAAHRGKPVVAVALLGYDAKQAPCHAIVLRKGIVIRSPSDFTGLTLISRRAGPSDALILREFLRQEGVKKKDVNIIDQVNDDQIQTMFSEGRADGGYMHLMRIAHLIKSKDVYVYRPLNWLNPEVSLALLVFHRDFLQTHRDLALKITAGYMKRIAHERSLPDHHRETTYKLGKTGLMALDLEGMSLPVYDYPPKVKIAPLNEMQELMRINGLLKGTTDLSGFIDESIVEATWQALPQPVGRKWLPSEDIGSVP